MFKIFFIILAIMVSFLPNSGLKNSFNDKLAQKIATEELPEQPKNIEVRTSRVPEIKPDYKGMSTGSNAAFFVDVDSGEILFEKSKDKKISMASTTKLMTALVALDKLELNEVLTVPAYQLRPLDSAMGLAPGTRLKTSEILHALLIDSAADAALTISSRLGGEHEFVALMNEKAKIFGLANTQFTNSVGYDDAGHYSTASDLVSLARISLSSPTISAIAAKSSYSVTDELGRKYFIANTNKLLTDSRYKGLKTGTTIEAGQCLISLYEDGERKILGVVLASPERFGDTQNLINWIKSSYSF